MIAIQRKALDGDDLFTDYGNDRCNARTLRFAINVNGAGTAHAGAVAIFRALKVELVSQDPQQGYVRFSFVLIRLDVYEKLI